MLETVKVAAPDKLVVEIDGLSGRRYRAQDGIFDMSPGDAQATVAYGGFMPNLIGGNSRIGYRCTTCGFGSWFKRCSRCETDTCEREA